MNERSILRVSTGQQVGRCVTNPWRARRGFDRQRAHRLPDVLKGQGTDARADAKYEKAILIRSSHASPPFDSLNDERAECNP
jgi:hypothetical protein